MPSNQTPLGALPARFRRERVLVVGCGDVGLRVARALGPRVRLLALTSSPQRVAGLRAQGIVPLQGNLDQPATLARLAALGTRVVHLAPPPAEGDEAWWRDARTTALLAALRLRTPPASLVYGSTSGVYGDCGGARVTEARAVSPATPRAQRRVNAEAAVRHFGRVAQVRASILRIPGIYAPDREGGTPRERLRKGTPVLVAQDDVYTNHIHADDLARAVVAALWRGRPLRVVHASDDSELKMGDYFDLAADLYRLPRPPRVARSTAQDELPLMLLSFMGESRRLDNTRLKRELRVQLRYPTVHTGLLAPGR
ncbi:MULTISPECIES: NAD-dependent epimerase/dehydratase family protein [Ramlibacter]|uniref:NAD-dependent epimerase/dehydratase family protein n=1 Tax=Ramlibacter pinisoli TaxID=2682844 RepID=A0A6N8ISL9_9BURK|nr:MULTISPECIES: NAD-dependent epimerase/dehydratase family protein [Ramlibacter]MBA2964767.1 NAD-dependent epimerase/dehydratase family protein [Ramlibacter sp. CGMCC 1.13660]MVQ29732.1 NAD-dependent epimerase/dehydratase family protein [Ramlibacter pinisoli]